MVQERDDGVITYVNGEKEIIYVRNTVVVK